MADRANHDSVRGVSTLSLLVAAAIAGALVVAPVEQRVDVPAAVPLAPASRAPEVAVATARPAPPSIAVATAMPVRTRATPRPVADRPESPVCGWNGATPGDEDALAPAIPARLRTSTLEALDARMRASADPAVQAAGLLIGARTHPGERRLRIEQLARLAAGTQDARIHAIAQEGCRDALDDWSSACHQLEPAQWARLDPDNAVPWLALAELARERGDAAAEDDAMYRAARARQSDQRAALLPALVEQALQDAPAHSLLRTLGLAAGWQAQESWGFATSMEALHYCMADDRVLADDARATTCDLLAHVLADAESSPIDLATAQAIGQRLGWPADRIDALTGQAAFAGTVVQRQQVKSDLSCSGVDAAEAALRDGMPVAPPGLRGRVAG